MAEELFAFTANQVMRLKRLLNMVETGGLYALQDAQQRRVRPATVIVGILTDAISATTALTSKPKVGTLNVYTFTSTGTADSGIDETVYSFAPSSATTDRWTVCERCSITGKWVLTTQYCS